LLIFFLNNFFMLKFSRQNISSYDAKPWRFLW
jgi:hypothetical protein